MSREWKLYFDDLQGFCEKVMSYTHGMTREEFESNGLNYDATLTPSPSNRGNLRVCPRLLFGKKNETVDFSRLFI